MKAARARTQIRNLERKRGYSLLSSDESPVKIVQTEKSDESVNSDNSAQKLSFEDISERLWTMFV